MTRFRTQLNRSVTHLHPRKSLKYRHIFEYRPVSFYAVGYCTDALCIKDGVKIDPCMGSGHILVYAFDVLMQIYESQGYTQREAARSILQYNLYGLDIDQRAAQLAYFAVMMKARQYDRRLFSRGIQPHVYAIEESNGLSGLWTKDNPEMQALFDCMKDAKEYGSILTVPALDFDALRQSAQDRVANIDLFDWEANDLQNQLPQVLALIDVAEVLAGRYQVVCTNPPYMGSSNMDTALSSFVKKYYPDSKSDLFAVFIERCGTMTAKNGYQAMITQHAWMFLSSFEKLRGKLLQKDTVNMAHLGPRAFEEIGGEVVQTTSFVLRNDHNADYKGTYCRLIEPTTQQGKEELFLAGENRYTAQQSNFAKIPGLRIGYWVSAKLLQQFDMPTISEWADTRRGLQTGNSAMFIRKWFEVSSTDENLQPNRMSKASDDKWFLFNSGGSFRRWYGNIIDVVNWADDGHDIKATGKAIIPSEDRYFDEIVSWNKISSGKMAVRYQPAGIIPGDASPFLHSVQQDHLIILYIMAVLNSSVCAEIVKILSPTLNFEVGNIAEIPLVYDKKTSSVVVPKVENCIEISKADWDAFETSWDFKRHPLL